VFPRTLLDRNLGGYCRIAPDRDGRRDQSSSKLHDRDPDHRFMTPDGVGGYTLSAGQQPARGRDRHRRYRQLRVFRGTNAVRDGYPARVRLRPAARTRVERTENGAVASGRMGATRHSTRRGRPAADTET